MEQKNKASRFFSQIPDTLSTHYSTPKSNVPSEKSITTFVDNEYNAENPYIELPPDTTEVPELPSQSKLILLDVEQNANVVDRNFDDEEPQEPKNFFDYCCKIAWLKDIHQLLVISHNTRIHGAAFRSQHGVLQERARHLASFPNTIHPFSAFIWYWDILVVIVLIFTLVAQPILIAFNSEDLKEDENIVIQCIISTIFGLDIFVNCRTGFVDTRSNSITLDPVLVLKNYLKTWFAIDVLSTIPYDIIYACLSRSYTLSEEQEYNFKFIRLLELLKIFRLVRVIRYLKHIEEAFKIHSLHIRVINLLVMIFFVIHWMACLHYLVSDLANEELAKKEFSWVTQMDLWDKPVAYKYLHCVLRALSNMVCLGYGNAFPQEIEDIICTILSILIGATCFALFIGNLASILLNIDVAEKKYVEVLNQVTEYMRFKQIPNELQNRVIMYYEQRYRRNFFNEKTILSSVSDVLRQELQMCNCQSLVEEVTIFKGLPQEILYGIVSRLKFEVYLPQDVIINSNTIGDSMFFIEHGAVSIYSPNGKIIGRLQDGDCFGEMALVTEERRVASVVATNYCDTYRLDKVDFQEAIQGYPEIYDRIVKLTQERATSKCTKRTDALTEIYNARTSKFSSKFQFDQQNIIISDPSTSKINLITQV